LNNNKPKDTSLKQYEKDVKGRIQQLKNETQAIIEKYRLSYNMFASKRQSKFSMT